MLWNSIFLPPGGELTQVVSALQTALTEQGYTLYDPFGALPGKAYKESARFFVAPVHDGWLRILVESAFVPAFDAEFGAHLLMTLDESHAIITLAGDEQALVSRLRSSCSATDLQALITDSAVFAPILTDKKAPSLPLDVLPSDVRGLAEGVDIRAAEKMFSRLSGGLMEKVSKRSGQGGAAQSNSEAAHNLIAASSAAPDWSSAGGRRILHLFDCLGINANYGREPNFADLRDAYALHRRRQRKPAATLYPGDAEVMATVANALDYTPVYAGKSA